MQYIDEYRNKELIINVSEKIRETSRRQVTLMEVCGGHTMAIHRFGLLDLLPPTVRLISGPGCPVCVSSQSFIDRAIAVCRLPGVITVTYGDLIRVPGTESSLEKEKADGRDIQIVYSALEAVDLARAYPERQIVFLGIGFETTAPATAGAIMMAHKAGVTNFFVLSAHKVMPPVMKALVEDKVNIDGFIAPGHVSAITGTGIYNDLASVHGLGVVISGFEPADIMQSILMLVLQLENSRPRVENQYRRVVSDEGNKIARALMDKTFDLKDEQWRGLGVIPRSGLGVRSELSRFDAEKKFNVTVPEAAEPAGCICGSVLKGLKTPVDCHLFATACNPDQPVGACMVSAEGTCATFYKYRS